MVNRQCTQPTQPDSDYFRPAPGYGRGSLERRPDAGVQKTAVLMSMVSVK